MALTWPVRSHSRTFSGSSGKSVLPAVVSKQVRCQLKLQLSVFVVTKGELMLDEATHREAKLKCGENDQGLRIGWSQSDF